MRYLNKVVQVGESLATRTDLNDAPLVDEHNTDSTSIKEGIIQNRITLIQSVQPSKVCKTYFINEDGALDNKAIANISIGRATTHVVETAQDMIKLLWQVTESSDQVICSGHWLNANDGDVFEVIPEGKLCELLDAKKGKVPGGVIEFKDRKISARLKRGIIDSHWLLLDADNPPGIPNKWAEMDIGERLALWEPLLPGISQCERVELRSSSSRISNTGKFGSASHAWIRISNPEKIALLKAHIRVQMVLLGVAFEFQKMSKKEAGKIVGIEPRSVFDLSVFDTGRLTFCAKPDIQAEGYEVADAAITVINEGGGALDISYLELPNKEDIEKLNRESTGRLQFSIGLNGQVKTVEEGKLKLSTEIESCGIIKTLGEWIDGAKDDFHLRCESPFRDSYSEAAFIGVDSSGIPFVYDIGNSTIYYLSDEEKGQFIFSSSNKDGYRPDFRPSVRFNDVVTDYVYIEEEDKYYRPYDGAILKPTAVNNEFAGHYYTINANGQKTAQSAVHHFHDHKEKRRAKGMGWHPVDQLFFKSGNAQLVNTYEGLAVTPVAGDVSLWLSLVRQQYQKYADIFLDHLAFTLQHPTKKINWQILTVGKPRTGKSMSLRPIKRIWGAACQVVDPDMMGSGWGDIYTQKKVVVVEEVWRPDDRKFFNNIKAGLVNDDFELLNMKGRGILRQQNMRSYYLFSNHKDALSFSEDEDKLLVIEACPESWGSPEQFKNLAEWSDTNAGAVLNYLLKRDVSNFSFGKLPVRTEAMLDMVQLSHPDYYNAIIERSLERKGVFSRDFFSLSDVRTDLREAGYFSFGDKGIRDALTDAGYKHLPQPQRKIEGNTYSLSRMWASADSPMHSFGKTDLFTFILHIMYVGIEFPFSKRDQPFEVSFEKIKKRAKKWEESLSSEELIDAHERVMRKAK